MINIEEKIQLENREISLKYRESNLRFLFAINDIIIKQIKVFVNFLNTDSYIDFFITYDGRKDIVYIWFEKKDELFVTYIGERLKEINQAISNDYNENQFISTDIIDDNVILELNYKNQRVIENNTKYNLKFLEI